MLLTDYLDRGFAIAPDAPSLQAPDGSVQMTHRDLHDASMRIAAALMDDGVKPGDRVGIFSPNDPWAFACALGTMRAGGVWVAINATTGEDDTVGFLTLTECSRLFYHEDYVARAEHLLSRLPAISLAVAIGSGAAGHLSLQDWLPADAAAFVPPVISDTSPALILGTGGTTGAPKAVPDTHRQLVLMSLAFNAHLSEVEPPRLICAAPMTHAAAGTMIPVLAEGGSVVVHQGVNPGEILASIEANRITRLFLPPTALYALLAHPDAQTRDFSSLQHFLLAAAPVAPERLAEAVHVFGPVMTQVYGQAEVPFICTAFPREDIAAAAREGGPRHRLASCGRSSLVAQVAIMAQDGTLLGEDEVGEIVIKSDLVFDGYVNNPEATALTRRAGGWHGTADVGFRDADGFVYIVDRMKDMIITGGFNVFPSEIENVIHTFAEVNDCAVIGVPDEKWGEAVVAVVEPKPGHNIDAAAILASVRRELGSVKTPKSVVFRSLPRSAAGKVLKRELREEYWAGHDRRV